MNNTTIFVQWVQDILANHSEFIISNPRKIANPESFDLIFNTEARFTKGQKWLFFKVLPLELTSNSINTLLFERKTELKAKKKFFTWIKQFLVFFYISENINRPETISEIGNFSNVHLPFFSSVHEINIWVDASTGNYLLPRIPNLWRNPLVDLLKDIHDNILEPYRYFKQRRDKSDLLTANKRIINQSIKNGT